MSIHDIYDKQRRKTGNKFSDKASYLRAEDEYSLNALVFVTSYDRLLVFANKDKTQFHTISGLLDEDELSIRAVERLVYKYLGVDIDSNNARLLSTKCIDNNLYDLWLLKIEIESEFDKIAYANEDTIIIDSDVFRQMIENNDFLDCVETTDINSIFELKELNKVKPLIRKSNLY